MAEKKRQVTVATATGATATGATATATGDRRQVRQVTATGDGDR